MLLLLSLNYLCFRNSVNASEENIYNIYSIGECGSLLKYKGIEVKTYYAEYIKDGIAYPAYCLDKAKQGVKNDLSYSVSAQGKINDVGLWRRIIHGYPYVGYQELGCANKEEAFTATKQAIYCYIHENKLEDYEAIGEAGQRTLNALKKIVTDAKNSTATSPSDTITINKENEQWQVDNIDKKYVSKIYSITTEAGIQKYTIDLTEQEEGIIITDMENNPKNEFISNEKFKILVPIKNMTQEGNFKINVKSNMETKPVIYGKSSNDKYQDYALTMASYEEGKAQTTEFFSINETKIKIIKKDEETNKTMKGVEFSVFNENKEILYKNLKTDSDGKIVLENLMPGTYYIQEQNTLEGYEKVDEFIEIKVDWMEEYTVIVNNKKMKEPEIEKKEISITKTTEVKRLPKTGM